MRKRKKKTTQVMKKRKRKRSRKKSEREMKTQLVVASSVSGTSVKPTDASLSSHSIMSSCLDPPGGLFSL
jgi:hypothetical protein